MTARELIDSLDVKTSYLGPSDTTAGDMTEVKIRRKLNNRKKQMTFTFHDNIDNAANVYDYVRCLLLDLEVWEQQDWDVDTYREFFVSPNDNRSSTYFITQTLKQLERNAKGVRHIFSNEEIDMLNKYFYEVDENE